MKNIIFVLIAFYSSLLSVHAQQKFEAKKENIKGKGGNSVVATFPDATDDAVWKTAKMEITLKRLSQFAKDTMLVFTFKIVRKEGGYAAKGSEMNIQPMDGKQMELYIGTSSLGQQYEDAVRKNVKPQYEANKNKVLVPKDPPTLKNMIDKVVIY
jgi:hypothetical protein